MTATRVSLISNILYRYQKEEKEKCFFPVMRTFRIYSLSNFQIYLTAALTIVIMLDIASLILIYNWKFVYLYPTNLKCLQFMLLHSIHSRQCSKISTKYIF